MVFEDRSQAGKMLAERLDHLAGEFPVVLALPRGGVEVGFEVAKALGAPLDVLVARKIGAPGRPELGIGAVAEGGGYVVDEYARRMLGLSTSDLQRLAADARDEMERRVERYRGGRPLIDVAGRDVLLVDDGIA